MGSWVLLERFSLRRGGESSPLEAIAAGKQKEIKKKVEEWRTKPRDGETWME